MKESEYVLIHDLARVRCAIEVLAGCAWTDNNELGKGMAHLMRVRDDFEKQVQAIEIESDK